MLSSARWDGYAYLFLMVAFTIYGQIVMKWQIGQAGAAPATLFEKFGFLLSMFLRPWVLSVFAAGFLASLCWMLALTRLPLSVAYPWTSLTFVGVIISSACLFGEPLRPLNLVGMGLLAAGIGLLSQK